jgi:Spy/CpxP family protein refolding chaperone
MNDHDSEGEKPATIAKGELLRRRGASIAGAIAGVALIAAFASSSAGHRMLAHVPGMAAAAAPLEDGAGRGFGPELVADWHGSRFDGVITEAVAEAHADRLIRHLAIEIDATAEQQDKLRAILRGAIKDLLPVREKIIAARATAGDLLTQETVDRAAIEKFRADMVATHDAVSKRLLQAVADAAQVLTAEQRRNISDLVAAHHADWNGGPGGHGLRGGFWRN